MPEPSSVMLALVPRALPARHVVKRLGAMTFPFGTPGQTATAAGGLESFRSHDRQSLRIPLHRPASPVEAVPAAITLASVPRHSVYGTRQGSDSR